ncbi:MAG: hypothetical protein KJ674_04240 [Nanoarchaeota archaeon]|nr:hypothetical protein [Nanoarchaeota archaeon]
MQNLKILNSKEKKLILNKIQEQFKTSNLDLDYVFLQNNQGRIFLLSNSFKKLDTKNLRINALGLYFANISKDIRLTIEGSQLIGNKSKNILEINNDQLKDWLRGFDIETDKELNRFVIIKNNNDFYGSGLYNKNKILNYIPKERRIKNL